MTVSHKDWNYWIHELYWLTFIFFSHLARYLNQLHFAVKELQTKIQKYWLCSSILIFICWSTKMPDEKSKEDVQTLAELSSASLS